MAVLYMVRASKNPHASKLALNYEAFDPGIMLMPAQLIKSAALALADTNYYTISHISERSDK